MPTLAAASSFSAGHLAMKRNGPSAEEGGSLDHPPPTAATDRLRSPSTTTATGGSSKSEQNCKHELLPGRHAKTYVAKMDVLTQAEHLRLISRSLLPRRSALSETHDRFGRWLCIKPHKPGTRFYSCTRLYSDDQCCCGQAFRSPRSSNPRPARISDAGGETTTESFIAPPGGDGEGRHVASRLGGFHELAPAFGNLVSAIGNDS